MLNDVIWQYNMCCPTFCLAQIFISVLWKTQYIHNFKGLCLIPFLLEAVEASLCYLFKNWLMQLKFQNLLNPLHTIV